MPSVSYQELTFPLQERESVLEGLERQGQAIPSSCRSGVCQSCLLQAVSGSVPAESQQGLKETLKQQDYFLACRCFPEDDIRVALPAAGKASVAAEVLARVELGPGVAGLRLKPAEEFSCRPGQYINLIRGNLVRSYSVANLPDEDGYLELHIKRMPHGRMSNWIHDSLAVGDRLDIRGPAGNCFYTAEHGEDFPMLLAGTGTGLAPLEGIARDALRKGHQGPIILIHGAPGISGIYHQAELEALAARFDCFDYRQSLMNDADPLRADLAAMTMSALDDLGTQATHVYLCGAPALVNTLKTQVFLRGVGSDRIFSDPFITAPERQA